MQITLTESDTYDALSLIDLSVREDRIVAAHPASDDSAESLLQDLSAECDDDCDPRMHIRGAGYSGPEAVGFYELWGKTPQDGDEWCVRVIYRDLG